MRSKPLVPLFFLLYGLCHGGAQAQDAFPQFLGRMEEYQQNNPREKVHVHLDKPYYLAGDDLWFKVYTTLGPFNLLSNLSKIVYVELIDGRGHLVKSHRLPLISGLSMGDFKLADTLAEGNYRIRAYTNWMRNFEEGPFFEQTIPIGNTLNDGFASHSSFLLLESERGRQSLSADIRLNAVGKDSISAQKVPYALFSKGQLVQRGRMEMDAGGKLSGNIAVADSLGDAVLQLSFASAKDGRKIVKDIPVIRQRGATSLRFFPESGTLLAGKLNKVGFKALHPDGLGAQVNGKVVNERGEEVATFRSGHAGMGSFSFTPERGGSYRALVDYEGAENEVPLPQVQEEGYTIMVNNELSRQVVAQISLSDENQSGKPMYVVAQQDGAVLYGLKGRMDKAEVLVTIPREKLPIGVITIALLDENTNLLAERNVFNYGDGAQYMALEARPDGERYGNRDKVDIAVETGLPGDTSRMASLSLSVTNISKFPEGGDGSRYNIYTSLLLSPAIKGYVEDPAYYFSGDQLQQRREMDNLMLTQGWSRVLWRSMEQGQAVPPTFLPEQGIEVSGRVTKSGKAPVPNAQVTMISPTAIGALMDTIADDQGRFRFDRLHFPDSISFTLQARDRQGKRNVDILLDSIPTQPIGPNRNAPDRIADVNGYMGRYLEEEHMRLAELQKFGLLERSIMLDEVQVTAEKVNPAKNSANLNGPGNADQVISGDELFMQSCPNLAMCLSGRLTGVMFQNNMPYSMRSQGGPMQIILDGMYVDADMLSSITPMDVASIEVLRSVGNTAIYGVMGGNGVLIITTRRGNEPRRSAPNQYVPGIVNVTPQGYSVAREFYSPDYDAPAQNPAMRDLRTTLLWKPDMMTDAEGKATVSFYTSDEAGKYQVVIEGIDIEGRLGRKVLVVDVE